MRVTFKNLHQQTFEVEIEPQQTVLELKKVLAQKHGNEFTVEKQRLIYAGKILEDSRTVESYDMDEKKFVVLMLKRELNPPIEQSKAAQATQQPIDETKDKVTTKPSSSAQKPAPSENENKKEQSANAINSAQTSIYLNDEDYERSIASIVEMGYNRDMVIRAMKASYNNIDRAVEYLLNGIPTAAIDTNVVATPIATAEATNDGNGNMFDFLKNVPQFKQIRSIVRTNPDMLSYVLVQIGKTNPTLLQMISANQDEFLRAINQFDENETSDSTAENSSGTDISMTDSQLNVQLTDSDRAAVERLKALGFPENIAIQAYLASDKNEELAASLLFLSADDGN